MWLIPNVPPVNLPSLRYIKFGTQTKDVELMGQQTEAEREALLKEVNSKLVRLSVRHAKLQPTIIPLIDEHCLGFLTSQYWKHIKPDGPIQPQYVLI